MRRPGVLLLLTLAGCGSVRPAEAPVDPDIGRNDYNPNHHRASDRVETLNPDLLTHATRLFVAVLVELAEIEP